MERLRRVDEFLQDVHRRRRWAGGGSPESSLKVGVDLGTSSIVLVVLDGDDRPVSWDMEAADVIRDGLVVDYPGALAILRRLKDAMEERLGVGLRETAIAVPSGTGARDCATHRHVAEGAGFEVTAVLDEPAAANAVLGIRDGAIVDIGGGTTGVAVLSEGHVVATDDEATGGTHLSLVIAGNRKISFEEAERLKQDPSRHREILPLVTPVLQKMGSIVGRSIRGYGVEVLYLVGGTCCLEGMEQVIARETGLPAHKPRHPFLVTPVGIAMHGPGTA